MYVTYFLALICAVVALRTGSVALSSAPVSMPVSLPPCSNAPLFKLIAQQCFGDGKVTMRWRTPALPGLDRVKVS